MSTRGAYGFHKGGVDKITYNHFDSYPRILGREIVEFCRSTTIEEMNEIFDRIILVDEMQPATKEQQEECIKLGYLDLTVSAQTPADWYCLLRGAQGDLGAYKRGLRYMIDYSYFLKESLFCEWAYIINLDTNQLEVYKGFQLEPHENRYALTPEERLGREMKNRQLGIKYTHYNCKLIAEYPLDNLPDDIIEQMEELGEREDEQYLAALKAKATV